MKAKITVKMYFRNSSLYRKISWIEVEPKLIEKDKETGKIIKEVTLHNPEELREVYQEQLREMMADGNVIITADEAGKGYIIDMKDVCLVEVESVEEIFTEEI